MRKFTIFRRVLAAVLSVSVLLGVPSTTMAQSSTGNYSWQQEIGRAHV